MVFEQLWEELVYVYVYDKIGRHENGFPHLVLMVAAASSVVLLGWRIVTRRVIPAVRRRRRGTMPQCRACGYAVEGLLGHVCPECGSDLSGEGTWRREVVEPPPRSLGRARRLIGWTLFVIIYYPFAVVLLSPVAPRPIVLERRGYVNPGALYRPGPTGGYLTRAFIDVEETTLVPLIIFPRATYCEVWSWNRSTYRLSARRMHVKRFGGGYGFVDANGKWREGEELNEQVMLDFLHAAGADVNDPVVRATARQLLQGASRQTWPRLSWAWEPLGKKDRYHTWVHGDWLALWVIGVVWIMWQGRRKSPAKVEREAAPAVAASA